MSLRLKVLQGTCNHSEPSLCFSCGNSQVVQGQAVSDLTVICMLNYERPRRMLRPVVDCSDYRRKTDQTRKDMEKIAWILETRRGKPIGFVSNTEHRYRVKEGAVDDPDED